MARQGPVTTGAPGISRSGNFWVITSYFNPMRYERRLMNYRAFRSALAAPLVTVELAYGDDFELTEHDADILVSLRARDVMWQKERLLNVAVKALPDSCRVVAWVDCDIIFQSPDWPERTVRLLDDFVLVQPFSRELHVYPDWRPGDTDAPVLFIQPSAVADMSGNGTRLFGEPTLRGPGVTANGAAWAARRELLEHHALYDTCIVGGGDSVMIAAIYGRLDAALRNMSDRQKDHYLAWARDWHDACHERTGVLDGDVVHLWHGHTEDRRYRNRHAGLRQFGFDPAEDIAIDENGSWRWNTDKQELHAFVRSYFAARNEDGRTKNIARDSAPSHDTFVP